MSPPPKSEPFSDVYESEIELKEDVMMINDDTLDDKIKVNESMNEINELIDSISNTTPVKSWEARNSQGGGNLEGSIPKNESVMTPILQESTIPPMSPERT